MPRVTIVAVLAFLVGCKDTDADGLTDHQEKKLGTNPTSWDSDGDGVSDLRETETLLSNPNNPDSDGDLNLDADEDEAGTDLNDPNDYIYKGGWPFYPRKDDIANPGWNGGHGKGNVVPRFDNEDGSFGWVDQFGDQVDLYDFAYTGKPIILDLSEYRCYYCHELAKLLEGKTSVFTDADNDGYDQSYEDYFNMSDNDPNEHPSISQAGDPSPQWDELLPAMLANGDFYWITAIDGDYSDYHRSAADAAADWVDTFPNEKIPVLIDANQHLNGWMRGSGVPWVYLLNEDMTILTNSGNQADAFPKLLELTGTP